MPSALYNRSTLRAAVQRELNENTTTPVYYTSDVLNPLINEAMGEWCERSLCRIYNWTIDLVADQAVYSLTSLSPRAIQIKRASLPTSSDATDDEPLVVLTKAELDRIPDWRSEDSDWPRYVIRDLQGPQSLRLYPVPSSNQSATVREGTIYANQLTGGLVDISGLTSAQATALTGGAVDVQFLVGSLQLYGIAHSTDLSDDSTTVETACGISPDRQDALLWYVCARCCEAAIPIAQQNKAANYWAKWAEAVGQAANLAKVAFQPSPATQPRGRYV